MLPAKNRLKNKENLQRVIREGSLFSFGDLAIKVKKNNLPLLRVAFFVKKKSARLAVDRNRIKRQLRGQFSSMLNKIAPGQDMAVYCNYIEKKGEKFKSSEKKIEQLLLKAGLIKKR